MIGYTDSGRSAVNERANDLMGFVPGATVELLGRDGDVLLTGTMDDRRKVFLTVPYGKGANKAVRKHCWQRRKTTPEVICMTLYYIRAKSTGAVVPLSGAITACSSNTVTVSAP